MAKRRQLVLLVLILTGAFAMYAEGASAVSDRMVVMQGSTTLCDQTVSEPAVSPSRGWAGLRSCSPNR